MLVLLEIIIVYMTGGVGLVSVLNPKSKLKTLPSVSSGGLIGISMTIIVLLNVLNGFSDQLLFIYCYHIPLIGVNVSQ